VVVWVVVWVVAWAAVWGKYNMSAILEFLNFMKERGNVNPLPSSTYASGPEGASSTVEVDPDAEKKAQARLDDTMAEIDTAEVDMEGRKAKYLEDKTKQGPLGRALSEDTKFLMETGSSAAAQQRAEGTAASQSQGPVQSSPGGVGTGKASAFARQKGAKAPPLQGKVPNLSTQVRMQNPKPPKVPTPQQMPVGQKMEKEDDAGYNIKGRPQRNVRGQKDKGDMKVTGKGVQNLQRIVVDRAKKLKDKEDTA